jgi:hypothetical protein
LSQHFRYLKVRIVDSGVPASAPTAHSKADSAKDAEEPGRTARIAPSALVGGSAGQPGRRKPSWPIINFGLDLGLLAAFMVLVWASGVVQFVFPAGAAGYEWRVMGWTLTDWRNFQFVTLCGLTLGIVVHVMFHWSWVCGLIRTKFLGRPGPDTSGADTLWGVGVLFVLLHLFLGGLFFAWLFRTRV